MLRRFFGIFQKPRTFDVKSTGFFEKSQNFDVTILAFFQKPGTFVVMVVEISGFLYASKSCGISQEITVRIVTLHDELNIVEQGFSSPRSTAYAEL